MVDQIFGLFSEEVETMQEVQLKVRVTGLQPTAKVSDGQLHRPQQSSDFG